MKYIISVLVVLCLGVTAANASNYYLASNGYYCETGTSNYFTRNTYYTAGYYNGCNYVSGSYYYTYTPVYVPYVTPAVKPTDVDEAFRRYDARILEDAATVAKFRARGISQQQLASYGATYSGFGLFPPQGATVYATQSTSTAGYGLANYSAVTPSLDYDKILLYLDRQSTNAAALNGLLGNNLADVSASALEQRRLEITGRAAIEAIRAINAKPATTTFRDWKLTYGVAQGNAPAQLQPGNAQTKATADSDPDIQTAIGVLNTSCINCHNGKAGVDGSVRPFNVADFFNLPQNSPNPKQLTYEMVMDYINGANDKVAMPKNSAPLNVEQKLSLAKGWASARGYGVPTQPVVPAQPQQVPPPNPMPAAKE